MAWTKIIGKEKKPLKWYMHKLFCEWGWTVRYKDNFETYYHHLDMCHKQGFNLNGTRILR